MSNYNVLIAEDNADFIEILKDRIASFDSSIHVVEASNGYEALDFLKKRQFDLLITDFNMPVMNGMELVKSFKSVPLRLRPKNVIMLSAFLEPGEPSSDLSFVRFLPKDDYQDSLIQLINSSRDVVDDYGEVSDSRVPLNTMDNERIRIDIVGKNYVDIVKAKDISLGGIAVYVPHFVIDCKIDEVVECKISLPKKREIKAKGKIKHFGSKNDFYFGIEFIKMDDESKKNLRDFVKSVS